MRAQSVVLDGVGDDTIFLFISETKNMATDAHGAQMFFRKNEKPSLLALMLNSSSGLGVYE